VRRSENYGFLGQNDGPPDDWKQNKNKNKPKIKKSWAPLISGCLSPVSTSVGRVPSVGDTSRDSAGGLPAVRANFLSCANGAWLAWRRSTWFVKAGVGAYPWTLLALIRRTMGGGWWGKQRHRAAYKGENHTLNLVRQPKAVPRIAPFRAFLAAEPSTAACT
jgi:hypothetical protein